MARGSAGQGRQAEAAHRGGAAGAGIGALAGDDVGDLALRARLALRRRARGDSGDRERQGREDAGAGHAGQGGESAGGRKAGDRGQADAGRGGGAARAARGERAKDAVGGLSRGASIGVGVRIRARAGAVGDADLVGGAQVARDHGVAEPAISALAPARAPGVVDEELAMSVDGAVSGEDDRVARVLGDVVVGDDAAALEVVAVPRVADRGRGPHSVAAREDRAHLVDVGGARAELLDRRDLVASGAVGALLLGAKAGVEIASPGGDAVRLSARIEGLAEQLARLHRVVRPGALQRDVLALGLVDRDSHAGDGVFGPNVERRYDVSATHLANGVIQCRRERHL